jgi:hypothetical protein
MCDIGSEQLTVEKIDACLSCFTQQCSNLDNSLSFQPWMSPPSTTASRGYRRSSPDTQEIPRGYLRSVACLIGHPRSTSSPVVTPKTHPPNIWVYKPDLFDLDSLRTLCPMNRLWCQWGTLFWYLVQLETGGFMGCRIWCLRQCSWSGCF